VNRLVNEFAVSERRACRLVGQSRATERHVREIPEDEPVILARMKELVRAHPRYGYRRIWALLRKEGFNVNRKRIYQLWKTEGYKVPQVQHKKRRLGTSENGCARFRPEYPNHIWAWDSIFDRDECCRSLKWLTVIDELTRECLELLLARHLTSLDVIDRLIVLMNQRGVPAYIRSACYESFVNSPSWAIRPLGVQSSGTFGMVRVRTSHRASSGLACPRERGWPGGLDELRSSDIAHDNGRPLPLSGSEPKPSGNSYATRATPFPTCSTSKISRLFMTAKA